MKLVQTQLKHIFIHNQIIFLVRIEKLSSKKLLVLKKNLLKEKIKLQFVPNKDSKIFFSNFKGNKIFDLFKGEVNFLYSSDLNWFQFYNVCKMNFPEIHLYVLYSSYRFFFLPNLLFRNKNENIFVFLSKFLFNDLLKFVFLINLRLIFLIQKSILSVLGIFHKLKNER